MCDSFPSKHAMLHMDIAPSNSKREGSGSQKGIGVVGWAVYAPRHVDEAGPCAEGRGWSECKVIREVGS